MQKNLLIIGGGFAGMALAKSLKNTSLAITIIDKTNHHTFQPLLYQVATSSLSPAHIAYPLREIFKNQKNVQILLGEVTEIDTQNRQVTIKETHKTLPYDYLVIAAGARHSYFGHPEWERHALGLKTIRDALNIREKMLLSFEYAEQCNTPIEREPYLRFVIVGAGPTGVEMAGAIAEIAKKTMIKNFRNFDPRETKILLVEAGDRVLARYPKELSDNAKKSLEKIGIEVRLNAVIKNVTENGVQINDDFLATKNVIWAAGNTGAPIVKAVTKHITKQGLAEVNADFSIKEDPNIFCVGDCAYLVDTKGALVPGVAPAAMQGGKFIAKIIQQDLAGKKRSKFTYFNKGSMATIGRASAIATMGGLKFTGFIAWLIWSFVHVLFLIDFQNKIFVTAQWAWHFFTYKRSARLIASTQNRNQD